MTTHSRPMFQPDAGYAETLNPSSPEGTGLCLLGSQRWSDYSPGDHALWARLLQRQMKLLPGRACNEFTHGLVRMELGHEIPVLDRISRRLRTATGWELVSASQQPGAATLFSLLAERRFPVLRDLRGPEDLSAAGGCDLFGGAFAQVPMLFNPAFSDFLHALGYWASKVRAIDATSLLERLRIYTAQTGLIETVDGLRAYGASLLGSPTALSSALSDPRLQRVDFDLTRALRTELSPRQPQETFFVVESFGQLSEALAADMVSVCRTVMQLPTLGPRELLAREHCFPPGH